MGKLSAYNIAFKGLTPEKHEFDYKIDGRFFELFENSFVDTGDIKVRVILDKENPVYTLKLELNGFVSLLCDRCLEMYEQPVNYETMAFLKFGKENPEETDEIIWLPPEKHQVNVAQLIYDYIVLSLPIKHIHPDSAEGKSLCNQEMLNKLKQYSKEGSEIHRDNLWQALKKFTNNN